MATATATTATAGDVVGRRALRALGVRASTPLTSVARLGRHTLSRRRGVGAGTMDALDDALRRAGLAWSDAAPCARPVLAPPPAPRTPAQIAAVSAVVDAERALERCRAALLACGPSNAQARLIGVRLGTALAQVESAADLVVPDAVEVTT